MNNEENPMADVATGGHVLVLDERITGQEQLIAGMLGKQISAGGAVIVLGASIEEPMLLTLLNACNLAGREADLLVVNPAKPATSHTYNPVLHSSPANIASQVMNFIANQDDSATNDAGTARLLEAIIACLQLGNIPYSFLDLGMFVMKPDAIAALGEFIGEAYPGSGGSARAACGATTLPGCRRQSQPFPAQSEVLRPCWEHVHARYRPTG